MTGKRKKKAGETCSSCQQPSAARLCPMCAAYQPCTTGIHVCGSDDVEGWPVTLASFPATDHADLLSLYDRLKRDYEEPDHDIIVDMFVGGELRDNFGVRRQMLDRIKRDCMS